VARGRAAAVGAILVSLAALTGAAEARVIGLTLPVGGMNCVLCARGIRESVKALEGIGDVTTDLAAARVSVAATEGHSLDILQVRERIIGAGFRIGGECDVRATGRFTLGDEGRLMFRVQGTPLAYQVLEGFKLKSLFRSHPDLKGNFLVDFRLHDHRGWKVPAITIAAWEALPAAEGPAK